MALSGVRNSWLMEDRNSDFARLADSAAYFANSSYFSWARMLAMLCVKRRTIPLKARNFAHFVILASVDGIGFGLFRVAPGGLEMAAEPDDGDQHEGAEDRQRGQRHDEGEKENVGDRAPQERPDLARHRRCIEPRHRNERRLQFGGVMFKFEAVSQQVFTASMSTLRHRRKITTVFPMDCSMWTRRTILSA